MRCVFVCLLFAFLGLFVSGCRHRLAEQPLTPQQQVWAEKMDQWNWKWRLPYHAPVRASQDDAAGPALPDTGTSMLPDVGGPTLPPTDGLATTDLPPVAELPEIPAAGGIEDVEMKRTFNNGLGMIAIVPENAAQDIFERINATDERAYFIGEIVDRKAGADRIVWA